MLILAFSSKRCFAYDLVELETTDLAASVQSGSSLQSPLPDMPAKIIFIQEHDPAVIAFTSVGHAKDTS